MSPTAYLQAFKGLNRDVRLFMVSVVVLGVCYMGLYSLLINLYLLRLGYGLEFIGVFVSIGAFSFAAFSLPAGMAGRRYGSRRPMLLGMVVLLLGMGALSVAVWVPAGWRSIWLVVFCGLRELGHAFYAVNTAPYLMGATSAADRDYAFSLRGTLTPVAAFLGSLIGGVLPWVSMIFFGRAEDDPTNYIAPLMLSSLLLLPGLMAMWLIREVATETTESDERGGMPLESMAAIAVVSVLFIIAVSTGQSFYNVYMDIALEVPTYLIGAVASVGQLLTAVTMFAAPALMARWGYGGTFMRMGLGLCLSLLPMVLVPHWLAAGASVVGIAVLMSLGFTALTIFHQGLVPVGWRPAMSGASMTAMGVGWGIVSSGGGYFVAMWGWAPFFFLGIVGTALGMGLFWWRFSKCHNY